MIDKTINLVCSKIIEEILKEKFLFSLYKKLVAYKNEKVVSSFKLSNQEIELIKSIPEIYVKPSKNIYRGVSFFKHVTGIITYKSKYLYSSWSFDKDIATTQQWSYCEQGKFCTLLQTNLPNFYLNIDNFILTFEKKFGKKTNYSNEQEILIRSPIKAKVINCKSY